jgi:hypothetical protein
MGQLVQGGFSRVGAVSIGWTGINVYICFSFQQCLRLPVSDLARSRDNTACQVNGLYLLERLALVPEPLMPS